MNYHIRRIVHGSMCVGVSVWLIWSGIRVAGFSLQHGYHSNPTPLNPTDTWIQWHIPEVVLIPFGTQEHMLLHTGRPPTYSDIYQRSHWYNWLSWWWALGCSKHVENWNKQIQEKELCLKLVIYKDCNNMHGQQNIISHILLRINVTVFHDWQYIHVLSPYVYLGIHIQDSWQSSKVSMTADWYSCPP